MRIPVFYIFAKVGILASELELNYPSLIRQLIDAKQSQAHFTNLTFLSTLKYGAIIIALSPLY